MTDNTAERDQFASAFTHSGFFVIRSPLLPFSELNEWGRETRSRALWQKGAAGECMKQVWEQDAHLLRERLLRIIERPEVAHALHVASGSLQLGIDWWKNDWWKNDWWKNDWWKSNPRDK